ncbi:MAG: glycosyltransferase, partial [Halieaceae bacterium]
ELLKQLADSETYRETREQELRQTQTDFQYAEQARIEAESSLRENQEQLREKELVVNQLTDKAEWLFASTVAHHGALLEYELSFLGRCHRLVRRGYRLLTFRRGQVTAYERALAEAHTFYNDHGIPLPQRPPRKLSQILLMIRYTLRHPVSSLRSLSMARLRTVLSHIRHTPAEDLAVWVNARFERQANKNIDLSEMATPPDREEVLHFPAHDSPLVSIIIPVFNEWVATHRCLWTVLKHTSIPYEVIVADDCSSDETTNINNYVTGIKVERQEENQRFLKNCNLAAQHAEGKYLLFLNNDTAVTANWLEPLVTLLDDANVGIVGPKLLFPDGKLQEAGGIIWQDASGWNFGRADDPHLPQYNYVRETDYVSGAALMIRHSLWSALGGFDEAFAPAYYEDTDLCFQARQAGFKVLYQPASEVVHYEGLSHGTDTGSGQKQYQLVNQQTFLDKWSSELQTNHFPNAEHVNIARDRSRHQKRVLIIDHYIPHYDKDAGSRSTWMYVEMMVNAGHRVQFMGANFFPHEPYTSKLQQMGVEVLVGESLARHLDRWFTENLPYVDHIFLHRPHIAEQFLPHLTKQKQCPPITFVGHDLHFLRTQREYDLTGEKELLKQAEDWRKRELKVINAVDQAVYFSDVEVAEVVSIAPSADVRAIPLYILEDKTLERHLSETPQLLFVAGFNHPPNIDAACWFVSEILPLLEREIGAVHLHIAGSNPTKAVQELAADNISVHGYVSDEALLDLYKSSHCAAVPLRFGAGVKGKVLEAIQYGVPLVTTSVGAEGIPNPDDVMAIADDPEAFAKAICGYLTTDSGDSREATRRWLEEHFSLAKAETAINDLLANQSRSCR